MICFLAPLLLWVPVCSGGHCVTAIDLVRPYFVFETPRQVSSDTPKSIVPPVPIAKPPSIASITALNIGPPVPLGNPDDFEGSRPYSFLDDRGVGVGVKLKNGTQVFKYWPIEIPPEDIADGPYAVKHSSGFGVRLNLKNGSQIHKFWYVNGTSVEEIRAEPYPLPRRRRRPARPNMRFASR